MSKIKVAIIGSGNIGTDLMIKIIRTSSILEASVMVGIDPNSDGLARAKRMGINTTSEGIDGLVNMEEFKDIKLIFAEALEKSTSDARSHYLEKACGDDDCPDVGNPIGLC